LATQEAEVIWGLGSLPLAHRIAAEDRALTREDRLLYVQAQMIRVKDELDRITPAAEGWDDLDKSLASLNPPREIAAAWGMVGLWLETYHGATLAEYEGYEDQENDLLF